MKNADQLSMKWHRFLVSVALPLSILGNILLAILYMSGLWYDMQGFSASVMYRYYPGIQMLDILYGVCLLLCAVYVWQTRQALKNLRSAAPSMLLVLYGMNCAISVLYTLALILVQRGSLRNMLRESNMVSTIAGCVVAIVVNRVYYQKRAHLFIF